MKIEMRIDGGKKKWMSIKKHWRQVDKAYEDYHNCVKYAREPKGYNYPGPGNFDIHLIIDGIDCWIFPEDSAAMDKIERIMAILAREVC
jgi:hypothetical protein